MIFPYGSFVLTESSDTVMHWLISTSPRAFSARVTFAFEHELNYSLKTDLGFAV